MILDKFGNKDYYVNAHPLFERAFAYIGEYLKNPAEPGVYEICGDDLFVKVQEYETREEGFLEIHDRYIDIQYMLEGAEKVYYTESEGLEPACAYDEKEDVLFFKDREGCVEFLFEAGYFAIFFPNDAHKPSMKVGEKAGARKLVFKVRCASFPNVS